MRTQQSPSMSAPTTHGQTPPPVVRLAPNTRLLANQPTIHTTNLPRGTHLPVPRTLAPMNPRGQNQLRGGQLSLHARVTAKAKLGSLALADSTSSNWPPLTTILVLLGLQCLRMPSSSNVDTPTLPHRTSSRSTTISSQYTAEYVSFGITRLRILAARRSTV
jgi:hypothetical protein